MSDASESSLPLAQTLARNRGLPVTLVTVMDVPAEFASWIRDQPAVDEMEEQESARRDYLRKIATLFGDGQVETLVLRGSPAAELVKYADSLDDPIIVMSSHGETGFRRMLVGSVLSRVVNGVSCPVLVVRAGEEESPAAPPSGFNKVLVPLDGSDFAEFALEVAEELFDGPDTEFHLIRVPEPIQYPGTPYGTASHQTIEMYLDAVRTEAEEYLERVAAGLRERGRTVSWEVRDGMIAEAISTAVTKGGHEMIAMASHGRTGFRRFFLGSVAERVLRESEVPLLLVGPGEYEEEHEEEPD